LVTNARRLEAQASAFANNLTALLNETVCAGTRVGIVSRPDGLAAFGTEIRGNNFRSLPVRLLAKPGVDCFLTVTGRLYLDDDRYLTVERSSWQLSTGPNGEEELLHFDYERGKDGYPDAHLQIIATSPAWESMLGSLGRAHATVESLHLPVGGKRYRPSLEDVLDFLICERIVEPKPYAQAVIERHRLEFQRLQLKAAVRRDPEIAALALQAMGYGVTAPVDDAPPSNVVELDPGARKRWRRGGKPKKK
jgi:hypothetical protein